MIDFTEILSQQVGSAPEPKPLPRGSYLGTITEIPTARKIDTKEGPRGVITVTLGLSEALEDVDPDELTEAGGLRLSNGKFKTVRYDFWKEPDVPGWSFQLDRFLAAMGHPTGSGSYADVFEQLPGRDVTISLETRSYQTKNGDTRTANDVKTVQAV